ncbi:MAG: HEPN domain-containing protein [Syntrophales bacterium]|jgi:uncharacterized protein (UPF0332 family)|nr:HEPN domain-containing protein [Syntrophales bacterium]
MNDSQNELIRYRLARAEETLDEARLLAQGYHWNAAVNRLYYACFYAVLALLSQSDLSSSKHSGVRSLFTVHFVKTGKLPKEMARTYNDLFERRQEGDYDDYVIFSAEDVQSWIGTAESFVKVIKGLIHENSTENANDRQ